ncbi:uncharacterized protein LOC117320259 [Pecten maximus]|uniref:uncharacterized protein LOC117320259 n=1 Tax=Pecten maximus TaxID=6579 RepID=UPI001458EDF3|nr:uncharacterized protein LOC117320259 [Pecten maximus]
MNFIKDLDRQASVRLKNKTALSVALAEHLFGKLSLRKSYTINTRFKSEVDKCQCGCGTSIKYRFGDTSIGQETVWHGDLDMVLGAGEDQIPVLLSGMEDSSPETTDEVKPKSLHYPHIKHQMLAQTILFSFLQKKNFPESRHFLVPSIGVSPKEVIFFFYDSENDVLIQSVKMPLRSGTGVCYSTIIAIWMTLNYRHLGSGITSLIRAPKSNFFNLAKDVIDIYQNDLNLGGIQGSFLEDTLYPQDIPTEKMVFWGARKFEFGN